MITKELRKYVWDKVPSKHLEDLIGIADAIDKAHDDELMQAKAVVLLDCISVADDFIELPKDADGKTIRVGDDVDVINYEPGIVASLQLNESGWLVSVRPHGWDTPTVYDPESIRHAKPDSWERIISEFAERVLNSGHQWGLDAPATTEEFVERCKRLAGEDA